MAWAWACRSHPRLAPSLGGQGVEVAVAVLVGVGVTVLVGVGVGVPHPPSAGTFPSGQGVGVAVGVPQPLSTGTLPTGQGVGVGVGVGGTPQLMTSVSATWCDSGVPSKFRSSCCSTVFTKIRLPAVSA